MRVLPNFFRNALNNSQTRATQESNARPGSPETIKGCVDIRPSSSSEPLRHPGPRRLSKRVIEIYAHHEKRKGLKNSQYHREQLKTWIEETTDIFKSGSAEQKFSSLRNLMQNFCRNLDTNELWDNGHGNYYVKANAEKGLYSGQKAVLEIIARQIKYLRPDHQYALLREFIGNHLEHMGHLALDASHDPQRKAIKMLAELLPRLNATERADLTALLTHKLTNNTINSQPSVKGIFKRKAGSTSDVAAQLIAMEFRAARRMHSKLDPTALANLKQTYEVAISDYTEQQRQQPGEPIELHSHAWKKAFNNEKLDPYGWTEERRKILPWEKPPRRYVFLELSAWKLQVARLEATRQAELAQMQALPSVHGEEHGENRNGLPLSHDPVRRRSKALAAEETDRRGDSGKPEGYSNRSQTGGVSRSRSPQQHSAPPSPEPSGGYSHYLTPSSHRLAERRQTGDQAGDRPAAESTRSIGLRDSRPAPSGSISNEDLQNSDLIEYQGSQEHLGPKPTLRGLRATVEAPTRERLLSVLRRQRSNESFFNSSDLLGESVGSQDTLSLREETFAQPKPARRSTEETLVEQRNVSRNKDQASMRSAAGTSSALSRYEY